MKRLIVAGSIAFGASGMAMAAQNYGAAGCGLGSIVIGPKKGYIQIFAATTNGTSGSQTFGITTGTSNCLPAGEAAALRRQQEFIAANIVDLEKDIARGDGEALRALAATLGCNEASYSDVAMTLQESYARIFAAPGALAVLSATKDQLRARTDLATQCNKLI